jgi:hypothetical protein
MTINSAGNVGIGTTTPTQTLTVVGTVNFSTSDTNTYDSAFPAMKTSILTIENTATDANDQFAAINFRVGQSNGTYIAAVRNTDGGEGADLVFVVRRSSGADDEQGMIINNLGDVGIGPDLFPEAPLHINSTSNTVVLRTQDSSNFKCDMNPGSGADWSCASDRRMKENIRDLESSIDKIMELKPRRFNIISNGEEGLGFIAQEVQEVFPDMVDDSEPDQLKVSTGPLMPRLVKAIQEQQEQIEQLQQELEELKKE